MYRLPFILALFVSVSLVGSRVQAKAVFSEKENDKEIKSPIKESEKALVSLRPFMGVSTDNQNLGLTSDLIIDVLDPVEGFGSDYAPWFWSEETFSMLDGYAPFIFRTKKSSSSIDELRVVITINEFGKVVAYKILNEAADKGLKERVAHVLRKMPKAIPVPGFNSYDSMEFELVMGY
ncbi:hypothetical protein MMU07_20060 [Aquiflexum sp. LQ15W]|uniref:hypothetical protein n=1 Tax=Cognataquiflexum nitidum TaxID=2922272 RepID=UPI001F13BEDE|nr:hypothetical protein [Cognataquiflexum nitidum]MCH6201884.1 hypothetical protein [Cognataquiflexum nitidum]